MKLKLCKLCKVFGLSCRCVRLLRTTTQDISTVFFFFCQLEKGYNFPGCIRGWLPKTTRISVDYDARGKNTLTLTLNPNKLKSYLTIIPRAWMGSQSIAHEAEWAIDSEAMRARGIIVLVKSN